MAALDQPDTYACAADSSAHDALPDAELEECPRGMGLPPHENLDEACKELLLEAGSHLVGLVLNDRCVLCGDGDLVGLVTNCSARSRHIMAVANHGNYFDLAIRRHESQSGWHSGLLQLVRPEIRSLIGRNYSGTSASNKFKLQRRWRVPRRSDSLCVRAQWS